MKKYQRKTGDMEIVQGYLYFIWLETDGTDAE